MKAGHSWKRKSGLLVISLIGEVPVFFTRRTSRTSLKSNAEYSLQVRGDGSFHQMLGGIGDPSKD